MEFKKRKAKANTSMLSATSYSEITNHFGKSRLFQLDMGGPVTRSKVKGRGVYIMYIFIICVYVCACVCVRVRCTFILL